MNKLGLVEHGTPMLCTAVFTGKIWAVWSWSKLGLPCVSANPWIRRNPRNRRAIVEDILVWFHVWFFDWLCEHQTCWAKQYTHWKESEVCWRFCWCHSCRPDMRYGLLERLGWSKCSAWGITRGIISRLAEFVRSWLFTVFSPWYLVQVGMRGVMLLIFVDCDQELWGILMLTAWPRILDVGHIMRGSFPELIGWANTWNTDTWGVFQTLAWCKLI